jgi:PadR family transcriptional regulator, regulatory protein PadR
VTPRPPANRVELLQGTLDLLVLQSLLWGANHGYAIAQHIGRTSGDVLRVETGSLYPALHRLERQGLVAAAWGISDVGARAKFYRLTAAGKKHLASEQRRWDTLTTAIAQVMAHRPEEG